jgi:uncharacterized membrane protein
MESLGLTISYAVHMLATVLWIGGLSSLALIVLPAARKLPLGDYATLLSNMQRRMDGLAWFSLALLAGTGMFQMSGSPQYTGFLAIDSRWALAILLKHGVFALIIGVSAYLTWGVLPALQRQALAQARGLQAGGGQAGAGTFAGLDRSHTRLVWLNLALAVIVLVLTAVARAAA